MRDAAILLCALLVALACSPSAAPASPGVLYVGFADDAAMVAYPDSVQAAVAAGFSYARIYISWADVATRQPADARNPDDPAYDWSTVDRTLAPYAGTGLDLMAQLWHTPAWANGGRGPDWYPKDPTDFGDFVYAAVRRYPQIHWWLPVNEPNRGDYVQPPTISAYEPMLQAAYFAVHSANPDAQVVAGSTSRDLGDERDAWVWAGTLAGDGMPMEAYAVHPYPNWTQPISQRGERRLDIWDLPTLHDVVGVPVMVMEYGWSTAVVSEDEQAAWLADAVRVARCTPGLTRFTLWGFRDHPGPGTSDGDQWTKFGLLRSDGSAKPAFATVQAAMHEPLDCVAVGIAAGAPPGWTPALEASVVPGVPAAGTTGVPATGSPTTPSAPSSPELLPHDGVPAYPSGAGWPEPGGAAPRGTVAPAQDSAAVIAGIRRTARTWWALVRLSQPMRVGGRVDSLARPRAPRRIRSLPSRPLASGVHRVRLGTLLAGRYRVVLRCRIAGGPVVVVRRNLRVR